MASPTPAITDYQQRFRDELKGQFWGNDPMTQYADAVSAEIQRVEDLFQQFATNTILENAGCAGVILDWLGAICRVARLNRTDADYKKIVQVSIAAYDSDGGAEQIIWIASQLFGADVRYINEGTLPWFRLEFYSDAALSDELLAEALFLIEIAAPPGVAWRVQATYATGGAQYDVDTYGAGTYGGILGTS